jgi:hypothetical protein
MGKTPEKLRLRILVDDDWEKHPKMVELAEKGHQITPLRLAGYDHEPHLILSRNAHMWNDKMWPLLDVTMKSARVRKKGQEGDTKD